MVIALAGAVTGPPGNQMARITNRNWLISAQDLSRDWSHIPVHFLNDLNALGLGLTKLQSSDLALIHPLPDNAPAVDPSAQKLVIGIGTGFNLSPVISCGQSVVCLKAEYGHVALPLDLHKALMARIGARAHDFTTVECCFSGRGLAALYAAFAPNAPPRNAAEIMAKPQSSEIVGFIGFYAELLALLSRNLLTGFLPRGGLYFAGTVARKLLNGPGKEAFVAAYSQSDTRFSDLTAPVSCILQDCAALKGCAGFRFPAA